ncbi:flagella basal body P-ring formation protein FlgA [Sphingomonas bacterium]|uniref:flagella basal body P-ring formation protein FlgA n=1 Tax=Sphingomonas bacterium TaxID=1895847 RepID=UPI0015773913|nr:flagella basal body P-ring formation protein FlgA [Sphingomonas bacterium]
MKIAIAFLVLLVAGTTPAPAAGFQSTGAIDRAVASFTGRPVGTDGGARTPVDPRLRLAACPMVTMAWRTETHDAVVVSCPGSEDAQLWRVFVPVLHAGPLPIAAGPVTPIAVRAPPVIRRGDPVLVEAGTDGFSITREGIAMGDAAPGARFLVRCDDAKGPVQAVAVDSGRATLPGW